MTDPIAKKLDDEWALPFLKEPDIDKVRSWLREQPESEIKLYLSTFEEDLDERHRARAALIREELERRAKPPPDRVKEILAWLRSKWPVAVVIVLVSLVSAAAVLQGSLCKLGVCFGGSTEKITLDIEQVRSFEEAVIRFESAVKSASPEGN